MKNPFQYGSVVTEEAFCNRKKEIADLHRAIENSQKLFLYSERRLGKTSLVKLVLARLPRKSFLSVYVDLWPTDSEASFVTTLARAITESLSTSLEKSLDTARGLFAHLTPSLTVDDDGKPLVTFGIAKRSYVEQELEEVLATPEIVSRKGPRHVVIVFDEFQRITDYRTDLVERKLRSIIQMHTHVSYLFLGSRKHIIQRMFLEKGRPLYRSATHYPIHPIDAREWAPFIRARFATARKHIVEEHINAICVATQGHPFYTQHFCHVLWELCDEREAVTDELIRTAMDVLLQRESYAYATLWDSLTRNQQSFVKALAREEAKLFHRGSFLEMKKPVMEYS